MKISLLASLLAFCFISASGQNCPPTTTVLNATCYGACDGIAAAQGTGNPPFTYQWSPGGQTTSSISGLCTGTYTVIVVNGSGCTGQAVVTVGQPTPVNVVVTGSNSTSCTNCNGFVYATANGGTPPYFYVWNPGNYTMYNVTGLCAGTYTCIVTDANGCTGSATWVITGPQGPSFSNSVTHASSPGCNNGSATVTPSNPGAYTYAWSPGGQTTQTVTGLSPGVYTVCVTSQQNGCSSCQLVTVTCLTGIPDAKHHLFSIYPNPASNMICISSENLAGDPVISLYAISGEKLRAEISLSSNGVRTISLEGLPPGMYFIQVEADGIISTKKILKE